MSWFIFLCLLTFSAISHAGGSYVDTENERRWAVGFEVLHLNPTHPEFVYAQIRHTTDTFSIKPSDEFAFRLEGSYFIDDHVDLTVNWLHFNSSNSSSAHASNGENLIIPFPVGQYPNVGLFETVNAHIKSKLDVINFEVGKTIFPNAQTPFVTRLHAGIQLANLDTDLTASGSLAGVAEGGMGCRNQRFFGAGPRAGLDVYYQLGAGFSLVGKASAAVLVGNLKQTNTILHTTQPPVSETATYKTTTAVPTAEGRLGAQYAFNAGPTAISIEGGYQVSQYFDALRVIEASEFSTTEVKKNFSYSGPYIGIRLVA